MDYSWTPGAILPFTSAFCAMIAMTIALRTKAAAATKPFLVIQLCAFVWCFFYGIELCANRLSDALLWANIEYLGITFISPACALFALVYSNRMRRPSFVGWIVLAIQPAVILPLVWLNPDGAMRQNVRMVQSGGHYLLGFDPGPAYYVNVGLSHALLLYAWGTFLYLALQRSNAFRKQARMIFLAFVFPVLGNIVYRSGFDPVKFYDLTPAMFSVCGVIVTYSLYRLSFLDLAPIARGTAVEQMIDPIIVMNGRGRLIDCNRAASAILELEPEYLIGQDALKLLQAAGRLSDARAGTGALYHFRGRVFAIKRSPLNDPYRGEIGQIVQLSDLTERLELERSLQHAKDQADAANRAKSNFLANMSHEIRTPMNGVIGLADLLVGTGLSGDQREFVAAIQSCSRSLMHIIDEILDFSKIEAGKMILSPEPVDLISLVRDVTIAHRVIAEGKGLTFVLSTPEADALPVLADPSALRQILNNIVGNATKFTATGSVSVRLEVGSGEPCRYRIEVEDTGVGIPIDKQAQVFDRFSQADESTTREFGGTGLGLTITKQLVLLMGGEVLLESKQGIGSCFRIELPLAKATLPEAPTFSDGPLHLRVLLAEDNLVNTMVIQHQLEQLGCEVTHRADGRATVAAFQEGRYDVVLLDVQMPVMGGIEACRQIRQSSHQRVPVVALTANALELEREKCLEVGMDAFLTKPTTLKMLRETLQRFVRV
ncbi:MAG: histidine kinase N-terminal 7TM domain-containing protein [Fimbriimonas sp.]|nr:histidine kinase N-terminal 7TM domain-containing protein [Fimbriimonas sp.]